MKQGQYPKMKAAVCTAYGQPEVLEITEIATPRPASNEVKIRIMATAVNSGDCRIRRADPSAVRLFFGLFKPRKKVLGGVFSGVVEEVGSDVKLYQVGDQVFGSTGMSFGAYAEYKCLPEGGIFALKPQAITHAEATAIPFGATTALHFLRKANMKKGQSILVIGASGAVGSAAVQLAVHFGAEVTAVCSTSNVDMVRSLGANEVIDYLKSDYSQNNKKYDVVFDTVNKDSYTKRLNMVKDHGTLILGAVGLSDSLKGLLTAATTKRNVLMGMIQQSAPDISFLKATIEAGSLRAVIDRKYKLQEIVEAHRYVDAGHKKGNVVVEVG